MAGKFYYEEEVRHKGLNKYRVVKAESRYELNQKVATLKAQWNEQWEKRCMAEERKAEREKILRDHEESLEFANERTLEAEKLQDELDSILMNSLNPKRLNINNLKDFSDYPIKQPKKPSNPVFDKEPYITDEKYNQKASIFVRLSKKKYEEFKKTMEDEFSKDWSEWNRSKKNKELQYDKDVNDYKKKLEQWQRDKEVFKEKQSLKNEEISNFAENFEHGLPETIARYYTTVIDKIEMPIEYDRQTEIEYNPENKLLVMDILLPIIDDLPMLKKVSYIKSKSCYTESYHTDSYMKKKYDNVIYQIVLQTINYVFKLDEGYNFIDAIVLNGKISTIDRTTGNNIVPYILSINVSKSDFEKLSLNSIEPKAWFKSAKGISAATFANVTPVAPIVLLNREDRRFIEGYSYMENLDETINLAAIDWQDFENLIREIFEQEFNYNGGEVKITQASRDGGVDAIAFDPDPIRGGKIVIQAKRYTNVVGVSAVRDLFGTVMNEGATKGILVTTSNYGNDAYEFAAGKPITLMNGANLLYLLEKHGHKARIDLEEAKKLININK
mgnify:CR=1 FL=1|jgi:restriction system protein